MNYTFEQIFIPQIVSNSNKDEFELDSVEIFDDFEFTEGCFGDRFPKEGDRFDWESFSIRKEMTSKLTYWLLRFPEPKKATEAKWGLIVKKEGRPFKYFTFEQSADGRMALCSNDGATHGIHSFFEADTSVETFIEEACAL